MDKAQIQNRIVGVGANAILLAGAFWPVWLWYVLRTFDRSDDPWGLLALATAAYFVVRAGKTSNDGLRRPGMRKVMACVLLVIYTLTFPITPHLVQGIIMVATLWLWFEDRVTVDGRWGILGLLVLSLPLVPSINFFAGYPLRLLVTQVAQVMLGCEGISSTKEGTLLVIGGKPVSIDAPCSGISMLWVELYTAMALAAYFKLSARRTTILTGAAVALVMLANSIRAVALILFDRMCQLPVWGAQLSANEPTVHVGVGVIAFAATAAATTFIAWQLSVATPQRAAGAIEKSVPQIGPRAQFERLYARMISSKIPAITSILVPSLCICAAMVPLLARTTNGALLNMAPPAWPTEILGRPVTAVQSLAEEKSFAADFPGYMRRFTDGTSSYFVRVVYTETRQLHPSSDCFKGIGYSIDPRPLVVAPDGTHWSSFIARKGPTSYVIMEQLHDNQGHTWTDVSEWYWHALMHQTESPWWDITVARQL